MDSKLRYKQTVDDDLSKIYILRGHIVDNPWSGEVWDIYKGSEHVYHKSRTYDNCLVRYGMMGDSSNDFIRTSLKGITIPAGVNPSKFIIPDLEDWGDVSKIRLYNRNLIDHPNTHKLLKVVKDYYNTTNITDVNAFQNLFGRPNTFPPHWNWTGGLQRLWGSSTGWTFNIGDGTLVSVDVSAGRFDCYAMFANTEISDITLNFNNDSITVCDSMFSGLRTGNWGTFNVRINHLGEHPTKIIDKSRNIASGFYPRSAVKMFRSAQPSQATLDHIMDNTNWEKCFDFNGAFASGLRTQHSYIKAACGCSPFEERPENTWTPNKHITSDEYFGKANHNGTHRYSHGLLETFMDSSIEEVQSIIDFDYLFTVDSCPYRSFIENFRGDTEGVRRMKRIRIKNLGNDPIYDFNNGHNQKNDGSAFDEVSVNYLIDHLKDLSLYEGDDQETLNRTHIMRDSAKLYCPESWRPFISEEQLKECARRRWDVYIGDSLVTPTTTTISYDSNRGAVDAS